MNRRKEGIAGYLFASPWLFGICAFMFYPLMMSIYYSFCDYSVLRPPVWIGAGNYVELFHDEVFWISVKNTLFYAAFSLPLGMIFGVGLAMLLNSNVKGMAIYRTIFFIPSLVPMISLAVLWLWMLNGDYGILNEGLKIFGIKHGPNWLTDTTWSKPALILMSVWGVGNAMLIYLASLQDVPRFLARGERTGWCECLAEDAKRHAPNDFTGYPIQHDYGNHWLAPSIRSAVRHVSER